MCLLSRSRQRCGLKGYDPRVRRALVAALLTVAPATGALAQHEGHQMPGMEHETAPADRNLFGSDMSLMTGMTAIDAMPSTGAGWHVMDLGVLHATWNRQGGPSGGSEFDSANWNMVHVSRALGPGRLSLMLMNSLEPATYPAKGSRELFQTGESYHGDPLVDRQHPHDFFMNLSATYRLPLGPDAAAWAQVAPVGEPASGPIAFMHRPSAGDNPAAPLGHHWQDSTHIAFHVVTAGGGWKGIALEGSVFRGREPDEHRWDIEGGRIDSAAVRARFELGSGWSAEASHAFLKNPEALEPGDTHRTTAAIYYGARGDRPFAATLLWGRNDEDPGASQSFLAEAAWQVTSMDQAYFRAEWVEKNLDLLATKRIGDGGRVPEPLARIAAGTVGYSRGFPILAGARTAAGADVTVYSVPGSLRPVYGRSPISTHVFFRVRWGRPHGGEHAGHQGHGMTSMPS
jgi:hypothetical protein